MSLSRKHRIDEREVETARNPKQFVIDRLVGAGFDLLRPIARRVDTARHCLVYLQDPAGTLAAPQIYWKP